MAAYQRDHSANRIIANKKYYLAHRDKLLIYYSGRNKKNIRLLSDGYIKHKIVSKTILDSDEIPLELIEIKRLHLTLKRELRKCKQNHSMI